MDTLPKWTGYLQSGPSAIHLRGFDRTPNSCDTAKLSLCMSQQLSLLQSCVCPMVRETQQTFEQMNGKYTLQRFHANYTC